MSSLLSDCDKYFNSHDLYFIIGASKNASEKEIKKAYYKSSLQFHPDRVDANIRENATKKFQCLGRIYSILSDKEKRAVYGESGEIYDEDDAIISNDNRDWEQYWRLLFPPVQSEDIIDYHNKYRDSTEELNDLKRIYEQCKGDMTKMWDHVLLWEEERIESILKNLIETGEIESYSAFTNESTKKKLARKRRIEKEAAQAKIALKEIQNHDNKNRSSSSASRDDDDTVNDDLYKMIAQRQESRAAQATSFLSNLEAKYCSNNGKSTKRKENKGTKKQSTNRQTPHDCRKKK